MNTTLETKRNFMRMLTSMLSIFILLAMAFPSATTAGALPACSDPLGCVTIGPSAPIHIAYALTIAGPNSALGIDSRNGIQIAIDDSAGKILGHAIQLDGVDESCSASGGAAAGAALAADSSIVAVIGTSCSDAARSAMPILSDAGFVMVSPSNTSPVLTEPGNPNQYPGYLRVSWNDKVQATRAAYFARQYLKVSKAATIHDGSLYSFNLHQAFVNEFKNLGGTITAQVAVAPGQTNLAAALTSIAGGSPQLLYFPLFMPQGGYLVNQARATPGLENIYLLGADSLWTQDLVNAAGSNVEGIFITAPDFTKNSPAYAAHFLPAYRAKFGEPTSSFHAHAYDAFMIIKAAIEKVAVKDPNGSIQIGRQALRTALYSTSNFPGLTGTLTCSATGDCADPHIAVHQYHTGQFPPKYFWPYPNSDGDTVGVFRPSNGVIFLKNANVTGYADIGLNYGTGGDYPITGDWNGDGKDTIGVYRGNTFYLRNSNTVGFADLSFVFGSPGDQPVAGDWNGDGNDTIGVYRRSNSTFYLRNSNTAGPPEISFALGNPGDVGITGDWNGDGKDTTGVFRPSNGVIFLKNTNQTGFADIAINFGIAGDKPVTGDWNNDENDTIGVLRGNTFYLRNSNTVGYADISFALGIPGDMPIAGNWDGMP